MFLVLKTVEDCLLHNEGFKVDCLLFNAVCLLFVFTAVFIVDVYCSVFIVYAIAVCLLFILLQCVYCLC